MAAHSDQERRAAPHSRLPAGRNPTKDVIHAFAPGLDAQRGLFRDWRRADRASTPAGRFAGHTRCPATRQGRASAA